MVYLFKKHRSQGQTLGGKIRSSVVNLVLMLHMVSDIIRVIKQKNRLGNIAFAVYRVFQVSFNIKNQHNSASRNSNQFLKKDLKKSWS